MMSWVARSEKIHEHVGLGKTELPRGALDITPLHRCAGRIPACQLCEKPTKNPRSAIQAINIFICLDHLHNKPGIPTRRYGATKLFEVDCERFKILSRIYLNVPFWADPYFRVCREWAQGRVSHPFPRLA